MAAGGTALGLTRAAGGRRSGSRAVGERPNVLYVTADDLGTRLGAYGHELAVTPRIDAFARDAVLFRRAYAQIAICGASRTSILTGLRPETTGVLDNDVQWRTAAPGAVTLVRHFRDAGYGTFGVGKIEDPRNGELDDPWTIRRMGRRHEQPGATLELLREMGAHGRQPWFAAVGFHQPHCPWDPDEQSLAAYRGVDVLADVGEDRAPRAAYIARCTPETRPEAAEAAAQDPFVQVPLTDAELDDIARRYLASITEVDTMFGMVLDEAEALGMLENCIVLFWSGDHGYQLGQHGWDKATCYDAATRIPLVMSIPGMATGGREAPGIVEAVDMYPTLVDLCGLSPPPQRLDGLSFAPLLEEPDRRWKSAAFNLLGATRSLKTERFDLIVDELRGVTQLFDLQEDPDELVDLAPSRPDLVTELMAVLDAGPAAAGPT